MTSALASGLASNHFDVWLVRPQQITEPQTLAAYRGLLSASEQQKLARFKQTSEHHHDSLVSRAFVRTILSHYAEVLPQDWHFSLGDKGKPEIIKPPLPLRFNLSHTRGLIACVVALTVDIGIDVEYMPRNNALLKIAQHKFAANEYQDLLAQPEHQMRQRFFDYWTLKESYIKAVGGGLSIPLDQFAFDVGRESPIRLAIDAQLGGGGHLWQSFLYQVEQDHRLAVSLKDPQQRPFQPRFFHFVPLAERTLLVPASPIQWPAG